MKTISNCLLFAALCLLSLASFAQRKPTFLQHLHDPWVNRLMNSMTLEQKVGQLFIAQAYSKDSQASARLLNEVKNDKVGGVIFMQGSVQNQVKITNELQKLSRIPLLICTDGEWGPGMRLKNYPDYPYQMTMGALENDSLIYQMGREIGQQFRRMGVHVNFAPVCDVNNNANNPVINYRSFGGDPQRVTNKAWCYAQGMSEERVLAVLKHFPGHGDTSVDSHVGLPIIKHNEAHLDTVELYPFQEMTHMGISAIMSGHIQIPALEANPKLPASLSPSILKKKLKQQMGYEGLIFTDAMNMGGVTKLYDNAEAAKLAVKAGNDMLEIVPDVHAAIQAVVAAVKSNEISLKDINYHCRRVLAMKKHLKLDQEKPVDTANLLTDLQQPSYELTRRKLYAQSLTALQNEAQLLPLDRLDTLKIASVSIGKTRGNPFQQMLNRYSKVESFSLSKSASPAEVDALLAQLKDYNLLVVGIHGLRLMPAKNYGTTPTMSYFLKQAANRKMVVSLFGNPYALEHLKHLSDAEGLLVAYQDNQHTEELAAQAIFGAISVSGKLPVEVNEQYRLHQGLPISGLQRLRYGLPEEVQIPTPALLHPIDSLANLGIERMAYPGCQVLIAIDGVVVVNKCYGTHSYQSRDSVEETDLYDIASVTKISSVTPALMKLIDDRKFNLDYPISFYYPDFRNTDKNKMSSREILAHQARLTKWIPFWSKIVEEQSEEGDDNLRKFGRVFRTKPDKKHPIGVAEHMYISPSTRDMVYDIIKKSDLRPKAKYAYSDLGFMLYPGIIEELTGQDFPGYLNDTFYHPLGAYNIMYNPRQQISIDRIPPTEKDTHFRKQTIRGHVHDEGAAMLGGVSGHAGLFASANDLAKLMQMYMQYGSYGGRQYIDSTTIVEFTRRQYPKNDNRRALGFDKPSLENESASAKDAYPSVEAKEESFGHTGFTGTMVWMDPKRKITFVFLSNRTYPDRSSKLVKYNIRGAMLDAIYQALKIG